MNAEEPRQMDDRGISSDRKDLRLHRAQTIMHTSTRLWEEVNDIGAKPD